MPSVTYTPMSVVIQGCGCYISGAQDLDVCDFNIVPSLPIGIDVFAMI
jgi:hypothetical protein